MATSFWEKHRWPYLSACHAGLLGDNRTPVGSGRFRDHAQDPRGILGMSFSSSLASNEASCGHTLTVGHAGGKVALPAQLRLRLEKSSIGSQPKEASLLFSSFLPFFFRRTY